MEEDKEKIKLIFMLDPDFERKAVEEILYYHRRPTEDELIIIRKLYKGEISWDDFKNHQLYKEVLTSSEYSNLIQKANNYLNLAKKNFERDKEKINEFILDKLHLNDLEMPPISVFITNHGGSFDKDKNVINW